MRIWKYELKTTDTQYIEMPVSSKLLTVQMQHGVPCLWCLVNEDEYLAEREIRIIGSGHFIENDFNGTYIGTYQMFDGKAIFHVFSIKEL